MYIKTFWKTIKIAYTEKIRAGSKIIFFKKYRVMSGDNKNIKKEVIIFSDKCLANVSD